MFALILQEAAEEGMRDLAPQKAFWTKDVDAIELYQA